METGPLTSYERAIIGVLLQRLGGEAKISRRELTSVRGEQVTILHYDRDQSVELSIPMPTMEAEFVVISDGRQL